MTKTRLKKHLRELCIRVTVEEQVARVGHYCRRKGEDFILLGPIPLTSLGQLPCSHSLGDKGLGVATNDD